MSKTLLPESEPTLLKSKDIGYREAIRDYTQEVDMNPLTCPANTLPHLAQAVQVLYWSKYLTLEEKRVLIANSKMLHKHLGTPFAIKKVFELLKRRAELKEWFEDDKLQPYHFKVAIYDLEHQGFPKDLLYTFELLLEVYKNVRSALDEIEMHSQQNIKLFSSVFTATAETIEIEPNFGELDFDTELNLKQYIALEITEEIIYKGGDT